MRVFIFPGQGSQSVGMGKHLCENYRVAKDVFEEVDQSLGFNLSNIIFEGGEDKLAHTVNTQPAIMTVSIALLRVLESILGRPATDLCDYMAGHSLGQYTALCAAGSITVSQAARLLRRRGELMDEACPVGAGAMAAVIGMEHKTLLKYLSNYGDDCQIANYNNKSQIVISGTKNAVDAIVKELKYNEYKAIKLNVSGAFHSNLMKPAEKGLKQAISAMKFSNPIVPIIDNVVAFPISSASVLSDYLVKQVSSSIKWSQSIEFIDSQTSLSPTHIVEIGPGKVLSNMIKKDGYNNFIIDSISNPSDINELIQSGRF